MIIYKWQIVIEIRIIDLKTRKYLIQLLFKVVNVCINGLKNKIDLKIDLKIWYFI